VVFPAATTTATGIGVTGTTGNSVLQNSRDIFGRVSATPSIVQSGITGTGATVGSTIATGGLGTTTGTTITGVDVNTTGTDVPLLQNQTDIFGQIVGTTVNIPVNATGTPTAAALANGVNTGTPILQNQTDMFGRLVGTTVTPQVGTPTTAGATIANGNTTTGVASSARGVGTSVSTVGPPGFTQVVITLQGTVQSELDRQTILNRFQGVPGFVVVDQLNLATDQNGAVINNAAGANTSVIVNP